MTGFRKHEMSFHVQSVPLLKSEQNYVEVVYYLESLPCHIINV